MSTRKTSKSSKDKDNSDKCGKCGKHVTENENAIQCEICDIWVHCRCQGISEEAYAILKDMNNLHWYCDGCDVTIGNIMKQLAKLEAKQEACIQDIKSISACTKAQKNDIEALKTDQYYKC